MTTSPLLYCHWVLCKYLSHGSLNLDYYFLLFSRPVEIKKPLRPAKPKLPNVKPKIKVLDDHNSTQKQEIKPARPPPPGSSLERPPVADQTHSPRKSSLGNSLEKPLATDRKHTPLKSSPGNSLERPPVTDQKHSPLKSSPGNSLERSPVTDQKHTPLKSSPGNSLERPPVTDQKHTPLKSSRSVPTTPFKPVNEVSRKLPEKPPPPSRSTPVTKNVNSEKKVDNSCVTASGKPRPVPRQRNARPTPAPRKSIVHHAENDANTSDEVKDNSEKLTKLRSKSELAATDHQGSNNHLVKTRSFSCSTISDNIAVTEDDNVFSQSECNLFHMKKSVKTDMKSINVFERSLSHDHVALMPPTNKIKRKRSKSLDSELFHGYENVELSNDNIQLSNKPLLNDGHHRLCNKQNRKQTSASYENIVIKDKKNNNEKRLSIPDFVGSLQDCIISGPCGDNDIIQIANRDQLAEIIDNKPIEKIHSKTSPSMKHHKPAPVVPYMGLRMNIKSSHGRHADAPTHRQDFVVSRQLSKDDSFDEMEKDKTILQNDSQFESLYSAPPSNKSISSGAPAADPKSMQFPSYMTSTSASIVDNSIYNCPKSILLDNHISESLPDANSDRSSTYSSTSSSSRESSLRDSSLRDSSLRDSSLRDSSSCYYNVIPNLIDTTYAVPPVHTSKELESSKAAENVDHKPTESKKQLKTKLSNTSYENVAPVTDLSVCTTIDGSTYVKMESPTKDRPESAYEAIDINKQDISVYEAVDLTLKREEEEQLRAGMLLIFLTKCLFVLV